MKTKTMFSTLMVKSIHTPVLLFLLMSSLTVSAQTIVKKASNTGETVDVASKNFDLISLDETRVITTAMKSGRYELTSWDVSSNSITKKAAKLMTSTITGIRSVKLSNTRFANAYIRNGLLMLEVWDIDATGTILTLRQNLQDQASFGDFNLIAMSSTRFLSFIRNADERLEISTWDVASNGALTKTATTNLSSDVRSPHSAISLSSSKFVVTIGQSGSSAIWLFLCSVSSGGAVSFHDSKSFFGRTAGARLTALSSTRFVFAATDGFNESNDNVFTFSVSSSNLLTQLSSTHSVVSYNGAITKINSSNILMASLKSSDNLLSLEHFKVESSGAFTAKDLESSEPGKNVKAATLIANTTLGRVVTGTVNSLDKLRLISWDVDISQARPENTTGIEGHDMFPLDIAAYPNPVSDKAIFTLKLEENAIVTVKLYNTLGEQIAEVANGSYSQGTHQVEYPVSSLPAGIYYYALETDEKRAMHKLVITH